MKEFKYTIDGKVYNVEIDNVDEEKSMAQVKVNGESFEVGMEKPAEPEKKKVELGNPVAADAADEDNVVILEDGKTYGEGATSFTFVVTDKDKNTVTVTVNTDEQTVGAALVALNLVSGSTSEYGLMVDTVNGITLDYNKDGMYWSFYINGEYAMTGVDATPVEADATYSFVATAA